MAGGGEDRSVIFNGGYSVVFFAGPTQEGGIDFAGLVDVFDGDIAQGVCDPGFEFLSKCDHFNDRA
ncbi:hypothetical protein C7W93_14695 [Glaciimonas sp. PCH181]|nr:hypothetical protein C7W93_14695 [Glaciimonas sp. PCH181]